jgi:hypothetical protein
MYYPPGMWPQPGDTTFAFSADERARLYELRDEHTLVVDVKSAPPGRVLVLAHEAQHVAQNLRSPAVSDVAVRLGAHMASDAAVFYSAMPDERDADAAATALRKALQIGLSDDDRRGDDRFLYDAPWAPPDLDSLPIRLGAFVVLAPGFDVVCSGSQGIPRADPDALLDALLPGMSAIRARLQPQYEGTLQEIANVGHTDETWNQLSREEKNRIGDDLRAQAVAREAEIAEVVAHELGLTSLRE